MANILKQLLKDPPSKELKIGGYTIAHVTDPYELERIYRQRHEVYIAEGYLQPGQIPDGRFCDEFDAIAHHVAAYDENGELVGSSRIVPASELGFPTERLFRLGPQEVSAWDLAEVGRLAVDREHRGNGRAVCLGLITQQIHILLSLGISHWIAFMHPILVRSLNRMGIPAEHIEVLEPSERELDNRRRLAGYFAKEGANPVLCSITAMSENLDI